MGNVGLDNVDEIILGKGVVVLPLLGCCFDLPHPMVHPFMLLSGFSTQFLITGICPQLEEFPPDEPSVPGDTDQPSAQALATANVTRKMASDAAVYTVHIGLEHSHVSPVEFSGIIGFPGGGLFSRWHHERAGLARMEEDGA